MEGTMNASDDGRTRSWIEKGDEAEWLAWQRRRFKAAKTSENNVRLWLEP